MHMIIRAIVYADKKEDALSKAREVFDMLTDNQQPFDYYQMFDTEGTSVSGKGRWGELPDAVLVTSKEGKKLVDEGMQYTKEEFLRDIKAVREAIANYSDDELFEDDSNVKIEGMSGMFKYFCHSIGAYRGGGVFLYNNDGEGITSNHQLENALSKYESIYEHQGVKNPSKDLKVWVVPADVHY